MQKQRDSKIELKNLQILQNFTLEPLDSGLNFLQSSTILYSQRIKSDSFAHLNPFYFKEGSLELQDGSLLLHFQRKSSQHYSQFQDQSHVQLLSFGRGYCEQFESFGREQYLSCVRLSEQSKASEMVTANIAQCLQMSHAKASTGRDISGQDLQSNSINSQSNIKAYNCEGGDSHSTGLLVKNVTKNMGKLLFKYIWKNRNYLRGVMGADPEVWEKLMCLIRACKKQNNVTRQFLLSRFHSSGEQYRLFRVLAHHFFRKHCLAAIFSSKIKAKRLHFERINKFNQALTNVTALDYLA